MGWGCSAAQKRTIVYPASMRVPTTQQQSSELFHNTKSVVVDMNAIVRKLIQGNGECTMSPLMAMRVFFKQHVNVYPNAKVIVFCFDSPSLIPEERISYHKTDRYAPATRDAVDGEVLAADGRLYPTACRPIDAASIPALTPLHIPGGSWDRFWNSKSGKHRMWEVLTECLEELIDSASTPEAMYIIDKQDGTRSYFPVAAKAIDHNVGANWGEADAKASHYAFMLKEAYGPVMIATIDWDMALQMMPHDTSDIFVRIGSVFETKITNKVYYSLMSANRAYKTDKSIGAPVRCHEILDCAALMRKYHTRNHRLEATFWCLAAGKSTQEVVVVVSRLDMIVFLMDNTWVWLCSRWRGLLQGSGCIWMSRSQERTARKDVFVRQHCALYRRALEVRRRAASHHTNRP
jgi:hypothetical protein